MQVFEQPLARHGFAAKSIPAERQCLLRIVQIRDHQYRNLARLRIALEIGKQAPAVLVSPQHDIEQDGRGPEGLKQSARLPHAARGHRLKAGAAKILLVKETRLDLVFNQQNRKPG
jgi:hypothetical protein